MTTIAGGLIVIDTDTLPTSAAGSRPFSDSGVYSGSIGAPLTVVAGSACFGAAAKSRSYRSDAAVSVTVAMCGRLGRGKQGTLLILRCDEKTTHAEGARQ